jgi:hypothetical protein
MSTQTPPTLDSRDTIAIAALQGLLATPSSQTPAQLALAAYQLADAMLSQKAASDPYGNS